MYIQLPVYVYMRIYAFTEYAASSIITINILHTNILSIEHINCKLCC